MDTFPQRIRIPWRVAGGTSFSPEKHFSTSLLFPVFPPVSQPLNTRTLQCSLYRSLAQDVFPLHLTGYIFVSLGSDILLKSTLYLRKDFPGSHLVFYAT